MSPTTPGCATSCCRTSTGRPRLAPAAASGPLAAGEDPGRRFPGRPPLTDESPPRRRPPRAASPAAAAPPGGPPPPSGPYSIDGPATSPRYRRRERPLPVREPTPRGRGGRPARHRGRWRPRRFRTAWRPPAGRDDLRRAQRRRAARQSTPAARPGFTSRTTSSSSATVGCPLRDPSATAAAGCVPESENPRHAEGPDARMPPSARLRSRSGLAGGTRLLADTPAAHPSREVAGKRGQQVRRWQAQPVAGAPSALPKSLRAWRTPLLPPDCRPGAAGTGPDGGTKLSVKPVPRYAGFRPLPRSGSRSTSGEQREEHRQTLDHGWGDAPGQRLAESALPCRGRRGAAGTQPRCWSSAAST